MARDFWSNDVMPQELELVLQCPPVLMTPPETTGVLETFWRRSIKQFGNRRVWRLVDGLSHYVNFQASAWGSHEVGRFSINLGVSSPAMFLRAARRGC